MALTTAASVKHEGKKKNTMKQGQLTNTQDHLHLHVLSKNGHMHTKLSLHKQPKGPENHASMRLPKCTDVAWKLIAVQRGYMYTHTKKSFASVVNHRMTIQASLNRGAPRVHTRRNYTKRLHRQAINLKLCNGTYGFIL